MEALEYYEYNSDARFLPLCWYCEDNHCLPHFHNSIELAYILEGELSAVLNGKEYTVHQGELLISSSFTVHSYSTPRTSKLYIVIIPMSSVPWHKQLLTDKTFASRICPDSPQEDIKQLMSLLVQYRDETNPAILGGISSTLLGLITERVGLMDMAHATKQANLIRDVLMYLQKHYTAPLSMQDMAAHFGYSTSRFSHIFNERLGCTLPEYVNALRCHYAAQLLNQDPRPILEVALQVGFDCPRSFYRAFKRCYGVTPTQYQEGHRGSLAIHLEGTHVQDC